MQTNIAASQFNPITATYKETSSLVSYSFLVDNLTCIAYTIYRGFSMRVVLTSTILGQAAIFSLAQFDVIPADLISLFVQLPLIGLFAWYVLKKDRDTREWIDHLMQEQEKRYNRTIDLFDKIIERQDNRQSDLVVKLSGMEKTLTLNTATVSESMRLSEIVDELKK